MSTDFCTRAGTDRCGVSRTATGTGVALEMILGEESVSGGSWKREEGLLTLGMGPRGSRVDPQN